MRKLHKLQRRIIAYVMVVLIMLNLCSGVTGSRYVTAEGGSAQPACSMEVTPAATKGNISITYKADKWDTAVNNYKAYRSVKKGTETVVNESEISLIEDTDSDKMVFQENIDMSGNEDGIYTIEYCLKDQTNTVVSEADEVTFVLDKTLPVVTTSVSGNESGDKADYHITVTETNMKTGGTIVSINRKTLTGTISNTETPACENGVEHIINFTNEGRYQVSTKVTDQAGNVGESGMSEFLIDKTKPEITITDADGNPVEGAFNTKNNELKLTLKVTDLSLTNDAANYVVKVWKDSQEVSLSSLTWSPVDANEFSKKTTLTFGDDYKDGHYKVKLIVTDEAGLSNSEECSFVIDKTAPAVENVEISYDSDSNKIPNEVNSGADTVYYLNDDAKVSFKVDETNREDASVSMETIRKQPGTGETEREEPKDAVSLKDTDGDTVFSYSYSKEGSYTTTIQAKDEAGNESTSPVKKQFVIDKTAPVFAIKRVTGGTEQNIEDNMAISAQEAQTLKFVADDFSHDCSSYKVIVMRQTEEGTSPVTTTLEGAAVTWNTVPGTGQIYFTNDALFAEEGQYTVIMNGQDLAGNEPANPTIVHFRIDRTAPVIRGTRVENGAYYNATVDLEYSIQEFNFSDTQAHIKITRKLDGNLYTEKDETLQLTGVFTDFSYYCDKEGAYTVYITAKDKAGNEFLQTLEDGTKRTGYTIQFVVDKEAPQLNISGVDNQYKTKNSVEIMFQSTDRNHDFDEYAIYVTRSDINGEIESFVIEGNNLSVYDVGEGFGTAGYDRNAQSLYTTTRVLKFDKEGNYEVTFRGMDLAGNEAEEKQLLFSIDNTAPVISNVKYTNSEGVIGEKYHNIYSNKAILVEFDVTDSVTQVDSFRVYVTVGTVADRLAGSPVYIAHKTVGNGYYVYIPTDLEVFEFDDTITIWASDILGNESNTISKNMVYNTSKPEISMECATDYSIWTNQDVVFQTKVSDEKSGLKEVVYKINGEVVKRVVFDELTNSYEYKLTASESASKVTGYPVTIEVTNNCGTTNTMKRQVYIDKVKPKVVLSGIVNGRHYNSNQVIKAEVEEVSYKNTRTDFYVTRTLDGKTYSMSLSAFESAQYKDSCNHKLIKEGRYKVYAITTDGAGNRTKSNMLTFVIDKTAPKLNVTGVTEGSMNGSAVTLEFSCVESFFETNHIDIQVEKTLDGKTTSSKISGFPKKKKKESMKHTFSEDGTYKVTISATDKAGNEAKSKTITFSVDMTKPVIQITGTSNYEQWDKSVTVRFEVEESYYSGNNIVIMGTRTDIDGNVTEIELPKFVNSGKVSSLLQSFSQDGLYHFEITSKDEAGNKDKKEINFVIDQTGPYIFKISELNGRYYQELRLADSLEDIFKDLTVISYRILLNGVEYNGTDAIQEEGKYNLFVEAKDELGHTSSEYVEFIIDHTAPKVIFTGVKDGEMVRDKGEIKLSLTNPEDVITSVRMNGVEYGEGTRILSYSEYGSYQIEVDCEDVAGNKVTRNIYFVYSNPVMIVVLIGSMTILAIGMCVWLWLRTRRKEEEEKGK